MRTLRPHIIQQFAITPTQFGEEVSSDHDKRLRQFAYIKLMLEDALAEATTADATDAAADATAVNPARQRGHRATNAASGPSCVQRDPWADDQPPLPAPEDAAATLAATRRDKRQAGPQQGSTTSANLQAAFQEVGLTSTTTSVQAGSSPHHHPDSGPTSATLTAADVAIGQALAGLSPAAREDAMRQILQGLAPQPDAKRSKAATVDLLSPMLEE